MNSSQTLAAGLADGVHDSQQAFRAVLDALARPGQVRQIGPALPGVALGGAMSRLLLSLCDEETPVWWHLDAPQLQHWLHFHTGADLTQVPAQASFAVFTQATPTLALSSFAAGSAAAPEFSTTLLMELPSLVDGPALEWHGPGIRTSQRVSLLGLPENFWTQWQSNHAAFPQGIDIVFTCGEQALGLPRTTRVRRLEGI
jgi:alpha-D-ribose 1-methylphosphonate 5-triphosphate synthase subunit PhnH